MDNKILGVVLFIGILLGIIFTSFVISFYMYKMSGDSEHRIYCVQNHAAIEETLIVPDWYNKEMIEKASMDLCIEKYGESDEVESPKP